MLAGRSTRAEQEVVRQIVVQSDDGVVRQEGKLLTIRVVPHVSSAILEVPIEIEVAVQVRHWLLEVIHNVSDVGVHVLIVGGIELIIEELVVPRVGPRVCHLQLLEAIIHIRVARVAARDFHIA